MIFTLRTERNISVRSSSATAQTTKSTPSTSPPTQDSTLKAAERRKLFNQIILIFTIGCIFGTYYEEILTICKNFLATGTFHWVSRRGLVYGPFSPVYGLGALGIYLSFYRWRSSWQTCFLGGALLGGMFEYALSILQEFFFHTRSWDYSDRLLDIHGRTTIPYMLFWGLLVVIAVHWLYPLLERLYQKLAGKTMNYFCIGLAVFLAFDITMSFAATLRQAERRAGNVPDTSIELFLDKHFSDERLKKIYDNAVYVEE